MSFKTSFSIEPSFLDGTKSGNDGRVTFDKSKPDCDDVECFLLCPGVDNCVFVSCNAGIVLIGFDSLSKNLTNAADNEASWSFVELLLAPPIKPENQPPWFVGLFKPAFSLSLSLNSNTVLKTRSTDDLSDADDDIKPSNKFFTRFLKQKT